MCVYLYILFIYRVLINSCVCVCVCAADCQRGVCVPSHERNTQETRRLHVVRRRRVRVIQRLSSALSLSLSLSACLCLCRRGGPCRPLPTSTAAHRSSSARRSSHRLAEPYIAMMTRPVAERSFSSQRTNWNFANCRPPTRAAWTVSRECVFRTKRSSSPQCMSVVSQSVYEVVTRTLCTCTWPTLDNFVCHCVD